MNWKRLFSRKGGASRTGHQARRTQLPGLPSEEEREAAYMTAPNNKLFEAVVADLREFAVEVSDRAVKDGPAIADADLRWHTGGQDALLEFLEKLEQRERDARLTQEQLEARKAAEQETEDGQN